MFGSSDFSLVVAISLVLAMMAFTIRLARLVATRKQQLKKYKTDSMEYKLLTKSLSPRRVILATVVTAILIGNMIVTVKNVIDTRSEEAGSAIFSAVIISVIFTAIIAAGVYYEYKKKGLIR